MEIIWPKYINMHAGIVRDARSKIKLYKTAKKPKIKQVFNVWMLCLKDIHVGGISVCVCVSVYVCLCVYLDESNEAEMVRHEKKIEKEKA